LRGGVDVAVEVELDGDPADAQPLTEVIESTTDIAANSRSSGVATADAMVEGLAPGSVVWTEIVGKSTCGNAATGRKK
jgi:hypothetical protein